MIAGAGGMLPPRSVRAARAWKRSAKQWRSLYQLAREFTLLLGERLTELYKMANAATAARDQALRERDEARAVAVAADDRLRRAFDVPGDPVVSDPAIARWRS